jgi:hypothetical protein
MTAEEFDQTMRSFVKRQPFAPFVVELLNGERIVVPFPEVAFGGGVAGFRSDEDGLVDFTNAQVRSFEFLSPAMTNVPRHKTETNIGTPTIGGERQSMTEEEFDQTLRSFVKRRPFFPFEVELLDGRRIVIANRHVAFGGGAACILSRKKGFVDFTNEEVRSFKFLSPEMFDDQKRV